MGADAADFVGGIPQHYDADLGPLVFADYAADMARRVAADAPQRVLETAAGTGILTRCLRDALPPAARLTASDLNGPMLDVARAKFQPGEDVAIRVADATDLPFENGSFDEAVCQFGLMFFPDKDKSFREVRRVLSPGGRYRFSVWDAHRHNPFARIAHDVARRFFPVDPPQFYAVPASCSRIDPIKDSLLEAGFVDLVIEVLGRRKVIPDPAAFARGIVYGNPLIDQVRARGGVDPAVLVEAILADLRRDFGVDPSRMSLQAIFYSAHKP